MAEDRCVCCGDIVPEGRMVCPNCEKQKPMKNLSHGEMVQIAEGKKNKPPRYIDANKLIDLATHEGAYGYVDVHDIYNAPTADVVEIVRKPIKGYEGLYEVDNLGRVFSLDRVKLVDDNGRIYHKPLKGKQLSAVARPKGYQVVTLTKDGKCTSKYVHRLVAEAFIPNPHGFPCINHKDECPSNNCPENLEWCTIAYNNAYGTGRQRRNEKITGRPLSSEHKRKIAEGLRRFYQKRKTKGESR